MTVPLVDHEVDYDQSTIEYWQRYYEDQMILAYVPEADLLTREDALALAVERDLEAAAILDASE